MICISEHYKDPRPATWRPNSRIARWRPGKNRAIIMFRLLVTGMLRQTVKLTWYNCEIDAKSVRLFDLTIEG